MVLRPETLHVAFATCEQYPDLVADDLHAVRALERRGIAVVPAVWERETDWTRFRAVVIRSTWTYWLKLDEFQAWLRELRRLGVRVFNSVPTVLGNLHKTYLADLDRRGLEIVPTRFVEKGDFKPLESAREWVGADDFILKPSVSGASFRTYRLSGDELARAHAQVTEIWESGPALLQPCLPSIISEGEYSYIFFNGRFSHAIVKRSVTGDYRIQWQFGGKYTRVDPSAEEITHAARYFDGLDEVPLYARVDLIRHEGKLVLMELELAEPCLFFTEAEEAADRFAEALAERLSD